MNVQYKDTYIFPHHYANAQELGDEVCRAFRVAFPNTNTKMFYFYNYADRSGRFVVNNGEIAILSLDKRIADLLGHRAELVSCEVCDEENLLLDSASIKKVLDKRLGPSVRFIDGRHWYLLVGLQSYVAIYKVIKVSFMRVTNYRNVLS